MDSILTLLSDRKNFPNLRSVVIAGHSAGGQYVSRYQMANDIHEKLKMKKHSVDLYRQQPFFLYLY